MRFAAVCIEQCAARRVLAGPVLVLVPGLSLYPNRNRNLADHEYKDPGRLHDATASLLHEQDKARDYCPVLALVAALVWLLVH